MRYQGVGLAALMAFVLTVGPACDLLEPVAPAARGSAPPPASAPPAQGREGGQPGAASQPAAQTAPGQGAAQQAPADGRGAPPIDGPLTVQQVAQRVTPAVVQIVTAEASGDLDSLFGQGSGRGSGRAQGIGSGVIYDTAGHILTNSHVVAGARSMTVALSDGRTFDARRVGNDPLTDLAVIQIQGENLPYAPLGDSERLQVGQWVVAIGNALGLPGGATVTVGVVSALGRTVQEPSSNSESGALMYDMIQTDAAINPGNSGGPLVNMAGEVIGINTMVAGMTGAGVPVQGIGFAIAMGTAHPIADELVAKGRVDHPYMGVAYRWTGAATARQLRAEGQRGALVQRVESGSPAAKAGMAQGDIITKIQGAPLAEEAALSKAIRKQRPGDTIEVTVLRDNQERTLRVTLGERPQS
jgi:serine protease Do